MPEDETEPTQTDIFQQQAKTIDTLYEVLQKQASAQPQQIIYASPTEPAEKPAPNYLLWIGIAVVVLTFFKRGK